LDCSNNPKNFYFSYQTKINCTGIFICTGVLLHKEVGVCISKFETGIEPFTVKDFTRESIQPAAEVILSFT
jgi:hypothetical protein